MIIFLLHINTVVILHFVLYYKYTGGVIMDGNRLKQLREERGLTQKELSIIMGLKSPSAIGMIERSQLLPLNF
jgi:hypothetical protein